METRVLSYNNVVLRSSDLHILQSHEFLNDTIIDFYFEYLSSLYQSKNIILITASISFLLANVPDRKSFIATIEPLNLHQRKLIFFTVNDNSNFSLPSGGSHWSLLVYRRKRNLFMHYDSFSAKNYEQAFSFYESVNSYISCNTAKFIECHTPRQKNGHDCGLYVLEIARTICECYFNIEQFRSEDEIVEPFDVIQSVDGPHVESNMRSELLQMILKLTRNVEFPLQRFSF